MKLQDHHQKAIEELSTDIKAGEHILCVEMIQGSGRHLAVLTAAYNLSSSFGWTSVYILCDRKEFYNQLENIRCKFFKDYDNHPTIATIQSIEYNQIAHSSAIFLFQISDRYELINKTVHNYSGVLIDFSDIIGKHRSFSKSYNSSIKLTFRYTVSDLLKSISDSFHQKNHVSTIENSLEIIKSALDKENYQEILKKEINLIYNKLHEIEDKNQLNEEFIKVIVQNNITLSDLEEIANRRQQLDFFKSLLEDNDFFEEQKKNIGRGDEAVWQHFFEMNQWVLGAGLTQIFLASLDDKKLEQVVSGFNINSSGKRVDALMKTKGYIETLCFIELKTHRTELLHTKEYRGECWQPSNELSGAVSQIQKTVYKAYKQLTDKIESNDSLGNMTGEVLFNYSPKAFLVVGSLKEFEIEQRVNMVKLSSFELYRKNIHSPEIITFDELYERAKFLALYS